MKSRPVVVVLAAGRGERFQGDGHKLEQVLGAEKLICTTIRHVIESRLPLVVVTRECMASQVRHLVATRDVILVPEGVPGGMGFSIAAGVSASSHASGWLILPGDMPEVRPASLRAVAEALEHSLIAYAQYRGLRGHPVGFGAELFSELTALTDDRGARRIVSRFPGVGVELDDAGVLIDIDTADDLRRLREARALA